ncbi:unnamed protein product [Anisakis simplex]|uniref:Uncharacterized protein n=1 Tax=Anisakis simplex TaxID=6269 RepID=A0A0M3JLK4_ANISI|nr:unnamed protein product [Anisakis simplex]
MELDLDGNGQIANISEGTFCQRLERSMVVEVSIVDLGGCLGPKNGGSEIGISSHTADVAIRSSTIGLANRPHPRGLFY